MAFITAAAAAAVADQLAKLKNWSPRKKIF